MSAFTVSHDHIDALLTFAKDKRMQNELSYRIDRSAREPLSWTQIGQVLLAENERSVCHRYPDCIPGDAPGTIGEESLTYRFRPMAELATLPHTTKLVWIIKACDCFDYQACETDDYEQSITHAIIESIRAKAVHSFIEYENAPWGISRESFKKRAG
jgi:hypothetical protein